MKLGRCTPEKTWTGARQRLNWIAKTAGLNGAVASMRMHGQGRPMGTFRFRSRGRTEKELGVVGKLGISLFFLFFFAMGAVFEVLIIRQFIRNARQYTWRRTPCRIVAGGVEKTGNSDRPYRFAVRYAYEYQGEQYTGDVYKPGHGGSEKYSEAETLARRYPQGADRTCYVNPGRPSEATLERGSLLIVLFILIPTVFVIIGGGGIYVVWFGRARDQKHQPIAARAGSGRKRRYFMPAFFGIFALAGAGMLYPLSIRPIARTIDAESWVETPCRVLEGRVRSHDSDDGTTYSVYVLYEYSFDGQTYKSDRYSFMGGSSSGYRSKKRVVDAYRNAEQPVCYVDPDSPHEAVLKRGFHLGLLFALFPLPFLAVGVGGLVYVVRGRGRAGAAGEHAWAPAGVSTGRFVEPASSAQAFEQVVLRPEHSPKVKLIATLVFAVIWNGIVSVLLLSVAGDIRHDDIETGKMIVAIPFTLVGLLLIGLVVYQFLALFNPQPTLKLRPGRVPLGAAAELEWNLSGRVERIGEFTIALKAREEATYRRGTDTRTDKHTFYEMELWKTTHAGDIASGRVGFVIPENTMHSFEADNNKIIWSIDVHGDIARWPDVRESFTIAVMPRTGPAGG